MTHNFHPITTAVTRGRAWESDPPGPFALWNFGNTVALFRRGDAMIGTLIGLILLVIVLGVLWWAVQQLLPLIPLAEPFATIVRVIMVVILVLIVVYVIIAILNAGGIHVNTFGFR